MNNTNDWGANWANPWPRHEEMPTNFNKEAFKYAYELRKVVGDIELIPDPRAVTGVINATKPLNGPTPTVLSSTTEGVPVEPAPRYLKECELTAGLTPNPLVRPYTWPKVNKLTEEQEALLKESLNKVQKGTASRFNQGKRRWRLLPLEVFEPVVKVLEFGADKYSAWNFAEGDGLSWTEVLDSMKRHIMAWERGEELDPESGESHLGHIGCNLMFLLYYTQHLEVYKSKDDRKKR